MSRLSLLGKLAMSDPLDLPRSTSIAIIGGGVMGLSAAWHLARRGERDVTVFETATVGSGASGRTGALLRQHYSNRPEATLAHWSLDFYQHWTDLVSATPVHSPTPLVVTVPTGAGFEHNIERLRANVAMQQSLGIQTRIVTSDELHALQPLAHTDDLRCAALESRSGYVDAPLAIRELALAVRRAGVRIVERASVSSIVATASTVRGVRVGDDFVQAPIVICAAGALTPTLMRSVGTVTPISAIRVQVAILQRPLRFEPAHFSYVDTSAGFFARPFGPGRSLVGIGGGDQHDPVNPLEYRESADEDYPQRAKAMISRRFPVMRGASPMIGWAGIYDMTPDAHPIIGAGGPDGLIVAAGFSGAGFKKAPAVGSAVADLALDGKCEQFDIVPFRLDRFKGDGWKAPWSDTEYARSSDFGHGL